MDLAHMFDSWKGTWLYDVPSGVASALGTAVIPLGAALLVVVIMVSMFRYIAKGGGQYGIIEGYVGTIGAGKTTLAVQHALSLARARKALLLSNIPVVCSKRCNRAAGGSECEFEHGTLPMNDEGLDLSALMQRAFQLRDEGRGLVLLLDEVGVVMPARLWKDFPVGLMWLLQQSRKLACEWIWTAQDTSFVDHQLRSLTSVVHHIRAYPPPSIWRRARGKRPWLMVASAYTPMQAPRANNEGTRTERRIGRRITRYRRRWELAFDTDGVVLPSKHFRGADKVIEAAAGDHHVIDAGTSSWGESMGGQAEPEGSRI